MDFQIFDTLLLGEYHLKLQSKGIRVFLILIRCISLHFGMHSVAIKILADRDE